jgi:hypothetical protein
VRAGSDYDFIFASLDLGGPDRAARGVGCATHPPFLRVSRTGERKEAGGAQTTASFSPLGAPLLSFCFCFSGGDRGSDADGRGR